MLSENIRAIMKDRKIGNKKLSESTGIPIGTLNKILYGDTKDPSINTIITISQALDCHVEDFLDNDSIVVKPYYSDEIASLANELHVNPELLSLLNVSRKLDKESLKTVTDLVKKIQTQTQTQTDERIIESLNIVR